MSFRPMNSNNPNLTNIIRDETSLPKINIMTYNVNFGGVSWNGETNLGGYRALQIIHEHSHELDIVCLQETHQGWEFALNHFKPSENMYHEGLHSKNKASSLRANFPHQFWDHSKTDQYLASGSAVLATKDFDLQVQMLESGVKGSFFDAMHIVVTDLRSSTTKTKTRYESSLSIIIDEEKNQKKKKKE
ncbi:hypothetical protein FDP41_010726 [Naegleria fowleri]|uniref:Endonuclease/exonuclease/phosphatase domain-containing protein n=1 Tax=Naegleria fowleri TaxID=5763 RepID=A0A6A5BZR2_NAEFO|nr:uncharacterized protein FDP41_010726 [Naegleria fowleri]KAF0982747.1 hypothetical protein FDP41_010726 [Naegleria fowleri]